LTGWTTTRLDGVLGQTSTGNNTLLGAVHANAECPAVIVLVQHPDELTGVETELILHGRLEVKLDTMDVVGSRCRAIGMSTSNGKSTGRGRAWRRRQIFSPSGARRYSL
jgi:hypothetical protein